MRISIRTVCALIVVLAVAPSLFYILFLDAPARLLSLEFSGRFFALLFLVPFLFTGREVFTSLWLKSDSPLNDLKLAFKREWPRLIGIAGFMVLIGFVSRFFGYNKNLIDTFVPFYLDPYLAEFEYKLFLGHHPWEITHWLFGDQATILIDRLYVSWFFVVPILFGAVFLSRDTKFQIKTALSLYFTWIVLGAMLAMAFSSVGPVFYREFYGSGLYDPLNAELQRISEETPLMQQQISQWLLERRSEGGLGSGISAMPSVHVALAWLLYLVVKDRFSNRAMRYAALTFALVTWIGSVHLAWHYVLDGLFSIIALTAFWNMMEKVQLVATESDPDSPVPAPLQT